MNQPDSIFPGRANAGIPPLENRGEVTGVPELGSSVADLYAVISVLDSADQSDLAGRLHALTLEIRERAAQMRICQYS
jgi:hypothetical protein